MVEIIGEMNIRGLYVKIDDIVNRYDKRAVGTLKNRYTIKYRNFITKIVTVMNSWILSTDRQYIILPRVASQQLLKAKILDSVIYNIPICDNIGMEYIGKPTYNQNIICNYLMKNVYNEECKKYCILKAIAGCHHKNTPIMLYNGHTKMVQNITTNDILMGDDSTPRNVLRLYRGVDIMYRITNDIYESYIVNQSHILCLKHIIQNTIIEISVNDYLRLTPSEQDNLREYKTSVEYENVTVPTDPYLIGVRLGCINPCDMITNIHDYNVKQYLKNNLHNNFIPSLKKLNLLNDRLYIPHIYKCNSKQIRLSLLAGIIDSTGLLYNNTYEIRNINKTLMEDIVFLCRSLGFESYLKNNNSIIIKNINTYIPVLTNKMKMYNYTYSYINLSKINITKLKEDNYYGFQLDNNNRYLMGDFVVTHNSGKSFIAFELIKNINKKTLIIVPNTYLLEQWVSLLTNLFPNNTIGQYYGKKKIMGDIMVAIINSAANSNTFEFKISRGKYQQINHTDFFNKFGFIIYDECHMYCTKIFKKIFNRANVENSIGLSATPNERVDGFDKLITFFLGDVIDSEMIEDYKKSLISFSSVVRTIKYTAPDEYSNIYINNYTKLINVPKILEEIITDPYRNQIIINMLIELYSQNRNVFVFSDRRSHLELLYREFNKVMKLTNENIENDTYIPEINKNDDERLESSKSSVLYGGCNEDEINTAKNRSKIIFTTYQYSSTGVSIVKMDTLLLTTPRRHNMTQIIGRIFRLGSDMDITRIIVDILDTKSVLKGQYSERKKSYKLRDSEFETECINHEDIEI